MEDSDFFLGVDTMIEKTLSTTTIKQLCDELIDEINKHRGKYVNDFDLSLQMGAKGEKIVIKFIESEGYIFLSKCDTNSHDFIFLKNGIEYVFEIKTDSGHFRQSDRTGEMYDTGNIVTEYTSRGKVSGLYVTNAEFFVTYFPILNELWLIRTRKYKKLIDEKIYDFVSKPMGDKDSETYGYSINRDKVRSEFNVKNVYTEESVII